MENNAKSGFIRLVAQEDAESIQAIYAPYIEETVISFEVAPPTTAEMSTRIQKTLLTHPWLIYQTAQNETAGYAYASKHRERFAYQWSVDVTVYLHPDFQGFGIGRALYTSLFAILRLQGFFNAFAGIALPNEKSIGLHSAMGFKPVGVYSQVGYKFGKWHDVSWWSLSLQPHASEPLPPRLTADILEHPEWELALNAGLPFIHQR